MNAQRLNDIYKNIGIAEKSDIDNLRQLTVDYPFYPLPYVVLAKYYFDTSHYKFDDMLRQAAMRVRDRKELYHYIHGHVADKEPSIDPDYIKYEEPEAEVAHSEPVMQSTSEEVVKEMVSVGSIPEMAVEEPIIEPVIIEEQLTETKPALQDFLADFTTESGEKPEEFVFEGKHEPIDLDAIDIQEELTGEEIAAEFSFSKTFDIAEVPESQSENEVSEKEEQPSEEEEVKQEEQDTSNKLHEDLRKNPVYKVEASTREILPEDNASPERDFFAWLQHPQYTLQKKETPQT